MQIAGAAQLALALQLLLRVTGINRAGGAGFIEQAAAAAQDRVFQHPGLFILALLPQRARQLFFTMQGIQMSLAQQALMRQHHLLLHGARRLELAALHQHRGQAALAHQGIGMVEAKSALARLHQAFI